MKQITPVGVLRGLADLPVGALAGAFTTTSIEFFRVVGRWRALFSSTMVRAEGCGSASCTFTSGRLPATRLQRFLHGVDARLNYGVMRK